MVKKKYLSLFLIILLFYGCGTKEVKKEKKHPTFYVPSQCQSILIIEAKPFIQVKRFYIAIDNNIAPYLNKDEIKIINKNIKKVLENFKNPIKCASFVRQKNQVYLVLTNSETQCTNGKKTIVGNISDNDLRQKMIINFLKSSKNF